VQEISTIYPLSLPRSVSKDPVIVGCLIQDYFPSGSMDVAWSKSGNSISEDNKTTITNFPPALASTGRTHHEQPCPTEEFVTCSVKHDSDPAKSVDVPCTRPVPDEEDEGLEKGRDTRFSLAASTGKDAVTKEPVLDSCGNCYIVSSGLSGCAERWNNGEKFTCTVKLQSGTLSDTFFNDRGGPDAPWEVHLLPPPSEELALNELVFPDMPGAGIHPEDVLVASCLVETTWCGKPKKELGEGPETYAVTSVLRVPAEAWKQGDNYSCMIGHEALPMASPRDHRPHSGKPTQVNVTVITSEADGVCY
ncbi:hypothetical protein U0070_003677, partial [Myodes glareolus]